MIERTVCVVLSDGCVPLSSQIRDTENKRAMGLGNPNNASGHDFVRSKRYTQAAVRPSSARPMLSCLLTTVSRGSIGMGAGLPPLPLLSY